MKLTYWGSSSRLCELIGDDDGDIREVLGTIASEFPESIVDATLEIAPRRIDTILEQAGVGSLDACALKLWVPPGRGAVVQIIGLSSDNEGSYRVLLRQLFTHIDDRSIATAPPNLEGFNIRIQPIGRAYRISPGSFPLKPLGPIELDSYQAQRAQEGGRGHAKVFVSTSRSNDATRKISARSVEYGEEFGFRVAQVLTKKTPYATVLHENLLLPDRNRLATLCMGHIVTRQPNLKPRCREIAAPYLKTRGLGSMFETHFEGKVDHLYRRGLRDPFLLAVFGLVCAEIVYSSINEESQLAGDTASRAFIRRIIETPGMEKLTPPEYSEGPQSIERLLSAYQDWRVKLVSAISASQ